MHGTIRSWIPRDNRTRVELPSAGVGPADNFDTNPAAKEETAMKHLVLVQAIGIELDSLRGAASRVAGETDTEWWTEARPSGTAFCFENANTRIQFCAICARHDVDYTTEG